MRSKFDPVPQGLSGVCWLNRYSRPRFGPLMYAHHHPEIEANVVESGSCKLVVNDRVQRLSRGDLFWLFPDQDHRVIEASDDLSFWVLLARPELIAQRAKRVPHCAVQNPRFAVPRRLRERERQRLHAVASALVECEDDPQHHADGLAWWYAEACRITEAQDARKGRPMHQAVVNALALLDRDPSIPLGALADRVHMSPSRLSHLFVEQVEHSVSAHRNQLKLQRFQELLQSGDSRNLTEAAFDAGFGSYAQCARVLKAHAGITPRELLETSEAAA